MVVLRFRGGFKLDMGYRTAMEDAIVIVLRVSISNWTER